MTASESHILSINSRDMANIEAQVYSERGSSSQRLTCTIDIIWSSLSVWCIGADSVQVSLLQAKSPALVCDCVLRLSCWLVFGDDHSGSPISSGCCCPCVRC